MIASVWREEEHACMCLQSCVFACRVDDHVVVVVVVVVDDHPAETPEHIRTHHHHQLAPDSTERFKLDESRFDTYGDSAFSK